MLELFTNTPCPICSQDPGLFNRLAIFEGSIIWWFTCFLPFLHFLPGHYENTVSGYAGNAWHPTVAINGIDFGVAGSPIRY
jgi:hypothetical protein